jgi:serine/threonine protein phosphatase PrpC
MLCTDGLYDALSCEEMEQILNIRESLFERGKKLVNEALLRNIGKGDNITFILIEFGKE